MNKIPVIGYNLIKKNVEYLKDGYIDFLINEKPEVQGYKAIYELYRSVVLGEEIQKSFMMPIDIITSEKIEYYLENYLKSAIGIYRKNVYDIQKVYIFNMQYYMLWLSSRKLKSMRGRGFHS